MTKPFLAALVVSVLSVSAFAQSWEEQVNAVTAAAADAAVVGNIVHGSSAAKPVSPFALTVECTDIPGSGANSYYFVPKTLEFAIHLGNVYTLEQVPAGKFIRVDYDGVQNNPRNAKLADYNGESVSRAAYSIRQFSCDTQDYEWTIATPSLVRQGAETSRPIVVHANVSTRGQTDYDQDWNCTAWWVNHPARPMPRD
jgi:hypothetical protein